MMTTEQCCKRFDQAEECIRNLGITTGLINVGVCGDEVRIHMNFGHFNQTFQGSGREATVDGSHVKVVVDGITFVAVDEPFKTSPKKVVL